MGICKRKIHLLDFLKLYLAILSPLYFGSGIKCYANEISFLINPNCTLECDKPWVVYGKQENENDTVHYLWSAVNLPSFIMANSVPGTHIEINWDELQAGKGGAISFTNVPENLIGISFQTLILFNDVKDTGTLDNIPEEDKKYASLSEFEWRVDPFENITADECTYSFYTTTFRGKPLPNNNTKISFSVTAYSTEGRSSDLPRLVETPFSSQVKIALQDLVIDLDANYSRDNDHHHDAKDDIVPISGFSSPRWAVDAIIVSDGKPITEDGSGFAYKSKKSLDDEYTPGVFDLMSITTEGVMKYPSNSDLGGYLQWRPVCYLTTDKDINYSTYPNINTSLPRIDEEHIERAHSSILYSLFGNCADRVTGTQTTVAFGLSEDEFYTKYNYTEWTIAMGLGAAPEESFSTLIIIIISVAVGLPCALFISGGAYLLFKNFRRRGELLIYDRG